MGSHKQRGRCRNWRGTRCRPRTRPRDCRCSCRSRGRSPRRRTRCSRTRIACSRPKDTVRRFPGHIRRQGRRRTRTCRRMSCSATRSRRGCRCRDCRRRCRPRCCHLTRPSWHRGTVVPACPGCRREAWPIREQGNTTRTLCASRLDSSQLLGPVAHVGLAYNGSGHASLGGGNIWSRRPDGLAFRCSDKPRSGLSGR